MQATKHEEETLQNYREEEGKYDFVLKIYQGSHGSLKFLKVCESEDKKILFLKIDINKHGSLKVLELIYFVQELFFLNVGYILHVRLPQLHHSFTPHLSRESATVTSVHE